MNQSCPDCNGSRQYVPLVGPPEPCRKCAIPEIEVAGPPVGGYVTEFTPVALSPADTKQIEELREYSDAVYRAFCRSLMVPADLVNPKPPCSVGRFRSPSTGEWVEFSHGAIEFNCQTEIESVHIPGLGHIECDQSRQYVKVHDVSGCDWRQLAGRGYVDFEISGLACRLAPLNLPVAEGSVLGLIVAEPTSDHPKPIAFTPVVLAMRPFLANGELSMPEVLKLEREFRKSHEGKPNDFYSGWRLEEQPPEKPVAVGRFRVPDGEWTPFEYQNSTVYVFGESHVKPGEPHFRLELRGVRTEALAKACPVNAIIELGTNYFTERFKPLKVADNDDGTWTLRFTYPENP